MPPIAASTGTASRRRSRSSPRSSSRLASSPTTRKNSVIRPSLTQWRRSVEMPPPPIRIASCVDHSERYESDHGEFAHASATTAAASTTIALAVSAPRKSRTGAVRLRAHAVRPAPGPSVERGAAAPSAATPASGARARVLEHERHSLPRPDAHAEHAVAHAAQRQLGRERQHVARAGGPERMADGDRAAVRV